MEPSTADLLTSDRISVSVKPSFVSLAWVFSRFGNTTFGGGSATMTVLESHIVDRQRWVDRRQSRLAYALARVTPGTNLLAYCTGVGWAIRRGTGAIIALMSASVPCSLLAVVLTAFYAAWSKRPIIGAGIAGALASAVAIMAATSWTIFAPHVRGPYRLRAVAIFVGALFGSLLGLSPVRVLALAAVLAAVWPEPEQR